MKPFPPDHPVYRRIRGICRGLSFCDEINFGPLYDRDETILSIEAVMPLGQGEHDIRITAWHGYRDGRGGDGGAPGFWLHGGLRFSSGESAVPLDLDRPGAGLTYPAGVESEVRKAVRSLHEMLILAEDTYSGLAGAARAQSLEQLNDAALEGLSDGLLAKPDDDPVRRLQDLCESSGLESVTFNNRMGEAIPDQFSSDARIVGEGGAYPLTVWLQPAEDGGDDAPWMLIGGWVQRLPREWTEDPDATWPDEDGELISTATFRLLEIHRAAVAIYKDVITGNPATAMSLLSAVGQSVTGHAPDDRPSAARTWQPGVNEFIRFCRLGAFSHVFVDESIYGGVDIKAFVVDPTAKRDIALQVFWKQTHDNPEPVHWIAADAAESPAHGVDPYRSDLLSGVPQESRYWIRQAIELLHEMAHVAADVVEGKVTEMQDALAALRADGEILSAAVAAQMHTVYVADAVAGLNGIARLYTGTAAPPSL